MTIPKKGCEIGGEAIGIPGVVVVRVAVRVHIAEVVACSTENAPTNSQWTAGIPKADRFYRNAPNFYDLVSKAKFSLVDIISAVFVAL